MKVFNLIFLGPQGAGKGTQVRLLAEEINLVVIDLGAVLREIAKEDTELGRKVEETIHGRGELVEPELAAEVMKQKLLKISPEQGVVIDGFPRTLLQYQLMKKFWPQTGRLDDYQVVFIDLSEEEAIQRLSTRLTCELCGAVYVAGTAESCENCGGNLIHRADDRPEAIHQRLEIYNAETLPMIKELEQEGRVVRIDGAPAVDEVHREILKKLNL